MAKVTLDDGRWFETEEAKLYKNDTDWNGQNHVSVVTGSQFHHQWLYRTKSGLWILNCWSNYQNEIETYSEISEAEAEQWLLRNGHHDALSADTVEANEI